MSRTPFLFIIALLALLIAPAKPLKGYALEAHKWPNGTIRMNLQLSSDTYPYPEQYRGGFFPTPGLQDFTPTWNDVAQAALNDWNQYLANAQFASTTDSTVTPTLNDGVNSVFFNSTAFNYSFGSDALAVTLRFYYPATSATTEADVVVNTAYLWDSYRGNLQGSFGEVVDDLRRVLDHEFGHVLGLDHPDLATPPQNVVAVMNSTISDLDHIELDDIAGVMFLYGQKTIPESISVVASPANGGTVTGGGNLPLSSTRQLTATPAPGYVFYQWDDGTTTPTRTITVGLQGGTYTAIFRAALDNWVSRLTYDYLSGLLYANNQFYAIASKKTFTSVDGVTWTPHRVTTPPDLTASTVAYGNGIFVTRSGSSVYTSTDGLTWTVSASLPTAGFLIAYGNGLFVIPGVSAAKVPTAMFTSPDGVHWTSSSSQLNNYSVSAITYGKGFFVAIGAENGDNYQGGDDFSLVSADGVTWTSADLNGTNGPRAITYGNGVFVLATPNKPYIFSSTDGLTWQASSYPQAGTYMGDISAIAFGNGLFVAISSYEMLSSPDGQTWTQIPDAPFYLQGVVYGAGTFVAATSTEIDQSSVLLPSSIPSPVLPVITSNSLVNTAPRTPFSYRITATQSPLAYNAFNLPTGLSINVKTGSITGTPTTTGTFTVPIFATNDAGSATTNLTISLVPVTQTFGQWLTSYSLAGTASDTPQHDGVPNLMKYLHDIDPSRPMTSTDRAALPALGITTTGANVGGVTLTYRQNALATGVTVNLQTSIDLRNWTTLSSTVSPSYSLQQVGTDTNNDPIMQIAIMPTGAPKQFYRLNVTSP